MEYSNNSFEMKLKRFVYFLVGLTVLVIIWKLSAIESGIDEIHKLKYILEVNKDQLVELTQQQVKILENMKKVQEHNNLPTIYAITPTYWRYVQKAELTRISQTLQLVPNIHWIIIEDSDEKTKLVRNLIAESGLIVTHLNAKTPPFSKLREQDPHWKRHRGVEQRNTALKWLRDNLTTKDSGIVYFMDDDNTYNIKIFKEMTKIKRVGVWPVGLVGGLSAELPILDPQTGKVSGYKSGWKPNRPFAIDMAGFAINLELILKKPDALFSYKMERGFLESEFLSYFTTKEDLEPLADNCTKVYVWHTRTENPKVSANITNLEV